MYPTSVVVLLCVYSTKTYTSDVNVFTSNTQQISQNMDDESRVSLRLWDVMEGVGVSERMRQLRRELRIREEIQNTIAFNMTGHPKSQYIFGSSIEATTTPGMQSDVDIVLCDEHLPVIDHIQQAPAGNAMLSVSESHTRPGYVKLQLVDKGTPLTIHNYTTGDARVGYDNMGRAFYKHRMAEIFNTKRCGPADNFKNPGTVLTDSVYAVKSRTFPRAAVKSLLECTSTGWLTKDDAEELIQYGCLYVGVGHPSSIEREYEWRISFSLQERQLMFRLNPTQHKCYVLLKFIKNMLTSEPDIGDSVTSYHCKTCLFRVITKTQLKQWTPENLIKCTFDCLTELLECLCNGDCPNFFIKTNNMFERRIYGEVKERLIHNLRDMINEGFRLFYRIESDNIGEALRGQGNRYVDMYIPLQQTIFDIYQNACGVPLSLNLAVGTHVKNYAKQETRQFLFEQLCYLSSVSTITEHTRDETKAATRHLEPILHKLYAALLASIAFSSDESKHHLLQASASHLKHAMSCDLMSGKLLHATILYRQGNFDLCCNLLEQLEQNLDDAIMTLCECYSNSTSYSNYERIRILSRHPDQQSMMESSIAACTVFLPSNTEIIPTALHYEMYRSVATPPESRRKVDDDWFHLAAVDSKVYIYFMKYLVYSRLNRPAAKRLATDNLLRQLLQERNLRHRETGYNLLGWIYSQEGQTEAAAYSFIQSWMLRPHHNAAKWHMLILIYRQYTSRQ